MISPCFSSLRVFRYVLIGSLIAVSQSGYAQSPESCPLGTRAEKKEIGQYPKAVIGNCEMSGYYRTGSGYEGGRHFVKARFTVQNVVVSSVDCLDGRGLKVGEGFFTKDAKEEILTGPSTDFAAGSWYTSQHYQDSYSNEFIPKCRAKLEEYRAKTVSDELGVSTVLMNYAKKRWDEASELSYSNSLKQQQIDSLLRESAKAKALAEELSRAKK